MAGRLDGKVAVVTGGVSGIGRATVELFVAEGARVVAGDIADEQGGQLIEALGEDVVAFKHADCTEDADVGALVDEAVARFGRLDVMYNNAGGGGNAERTPWDELDIEGFDRGIANNLRSVALGHKHAARIMKPQGGGAIISTASIAGFQGGWTLPSYDTAKGAIYNLVRSATAQLGRYGIRSNAIAPGITLTPAFGRAFELAPTELDRFLELVGDVTADYQPLGRAGTPQDIANAALFLASDDSAWISGQTLIVDGGVTCVTTHSLGAAFGEAYERLRAER